MKRTHKFRALSGDASAIVAAAGSLNEAAAKLGVDRSTLHRWIVAGKVARPRNDGAAPRARRSGRTPAVGPATAKKILSPAAWARSVQRAYELNDTERTLLELARRARELAESPTTAPAVQLAAMGRYQQLVKQLNLEEESPNHGEAETSKSARVAQFPRRV